MLGFSWTIMTEWRMASQPAGRPTPTCRGERICRASRRTALAAHLEVNLRSTSPTANGRRPPPFFRQGRREAPHRCWMTACGDVLSEVAANPSQIGPWCKLFMLPKCVLVTPPVHLPGLVTAAMVLAPVVLWKTVSTGRPFSPSLPWGLPSHPPMFSTI